MSARLAVSVIICTRDRPAQLDEAMASAVKHARRGDELIVVDSASRSGLVREVASAAGARVIRVEQPGLSRARNAGLQAAGTPVVAFTDDDCRITEGWADALARAFASDPAVAFVTGRVVADRARRLPVSCFEGAEIRRFAGPTDPTQCGTGANMAFRRDACLQAGGFDEQLGAGARWRAGEDTDMFWRLTRAGWAGLYVPEATVCHVQWRSDSEAVRMAYGYGVGAGALAMKAVRTGERDGWRFLGRRLWGDGFVAAWRDLRAGYQTGALARCTGAAGTALGAIQACRRPVRAGCYC